MIVCDLSHAGEFCRDKNTAVTIGKFDGIHRGHTELIRHVTEKKGDGLLSAVLSIDMNAGGAGKSILSTAEEEKILKDLGVGMLVRIPFTKEFASLPAEVFAEDILVRTLHAEAVVSGEDFRFGSGRIGNAAFLTSMQNRLGFEYECVPRVFYGSRPVSSTRIRECLACGRTEEAAGCLGRPYAIEGTVIRGMHLASSLGFPTANIRPDPGKLLPRYGVYRVFCMLDNVKAAGMANIGVKPTVTSAGEPLLEVFFPGFSGDLYGRTLHVEFDSFIRPEKKFASAEELKKQITEDLKRI